MAQGITIKSNNFDGESVEITFNPYTGGTINLGTQTIPYDYLTDYYDGEYSIYIPSANKTCDLVVGVPPSPSVTPNQTNTPTPTITSTPTPTPTPSPFVASVSIEPTETTKYNFLSLSGSSNVSNPTYIWSLSDFYDYSGNTITSYTGQTTPVGEFRNTGSTLVELSVVGENPFGTTITATTNVFDVIIPTTYRAYFGDVGTNNLYYTEDMINYSSTTMPQNMDIGISTNIEYSPLLDIYVMGSVNKSFYSYDGINWSATTLSVSSRFAKIIWVPELQIFASVGDNNNYSHISSDGVNWTSHGTFNWGSASSQWFVWDSVNQQFLLKDTSGDIWSSDDNITWNLIYANPTPTSRFSVLLTYNGLTSLINNAQDYVKYSTDGINWNLGTISNLTTEFCMDGLVLPDGRRVTTGRPTGGQTFSDNGIDFVEITPPAGMEDNALSPFYNEVEDKIFVSCRGNDIIVSDDRGETYTLETGLPFTDGRITGIKYNI